MKTNKNEQLKVKPLKCIIVTFIDKLLANGNKIIVLIVAIKLKRKFKTLNNMIEHREKRN